MTKKVADNIEMIKAARLKLLSHFPYFSTAVLRMKLVPTPGLGTLAVDHHWNMLYDPSLDWDLETMTTGILHELYHILRDHAGRSNRRENVDRRIWNYAGDVEINDDIRETKHARFVPKLPKGALSAKTIEVEGHPIAEGLLAEEYYDYIMMYWQKERIALVGSPSEGGHAPGEGHCGKCAEGPSAEDKEKDSGSAEGGTLSEVEKELIRHQVAKDIAANPPGSVPRGLSTWAKSQLEPKINWRTKLMASVRFAKSDVSGLVDYSYKRISRRQSVYGKIVQPSLRKPTPELAILFDTSGSMDAHRTEQGIAEVRGVLRQAGITDGVSVVSCDAAVHASKKTFSADKLNLFGGGGTDMTLGLAVLNGEATMVDGKVYKPVPDIAIVITDGYTGWPEQKPSRIKNVIIVILDATNGSLDGHYNPPAWARDVIYVPLSRV